MYYNPFLKRAKKVVTEDNSLQIGPCMATTYLISPNKIKPRKNVLWSRNLFISIQHKRVLPVWFWSTGWCELVLRPHSPVYTIKRTESHNISYSNSLKSTYSLSTADELTVGSVSLYQGMKGNYSHWLQWIKHKSNNST